MTKDKDFKQLARARSARTGESYTTARRNLAAKTSGATPTPQGHFVEDDIDRVARRVYFSRASKGYGGAGAKATGMERALVIVGGRIEVKMAAAFRNYGFNRYSVDATSGDRSSVFIYGENEITIQSRVDGSEWRGLVAEGLRTDHPVRLTFSAALPDNLEALPSVVARFLPMTLPREKGELAEYVPVPEDGFPAWKPTTIKSWFPLMGASRESLVTPRLITCRGLAELKVGRNTIEVYRYDHVDREGKLHATTWVGEDDAVIRYEQTGLLLKAVSEEEALKLDPGADE